jgi:hypothetical protein
VARAAGKKQSRRKSPSKNARSARSGASRAGAKRRAPARKKSAASAAKRRVKRAAPKRSAAPKRRMPAARRPLAKRPAPVRRAPAATPAVAAAFATQRAHATSREELLFELARARAAVKAAIQGLSVANATRAIAPGKWSPLEIVLHLGERDRVRLEEFHRALHGQPRTWAGISDAEQAAVNEQHLSPLRALTWDSAVRRLESLREQLLLRLHEVPALPDDVWQRGHAFADMMWGLPEHDRHHAAQIKRARTGEPVLTED